MPFGSWDGSANAMNRANWYCFSTCSLIASAAMTTPAVTSPSIHRFGTPDTAMIPNTIDPSTITVPRSGCSITRITGTAATAMACATSMVRAVSRWSVSPFSAISNAIPTITASLANSLGWIDIQGSWIHDREDEADGEVQRVTDQEGVLVAVGERGPPVRRRPDQHRADERQREYTEREDPVHLPHGRPPIHPRPGPDRSQQRHSPAPALAVIASASSARRPVWA